VLERMDGWTAVLAACASSFGRALVSST